MFNDKKSLKSFSEAEQSCKDNNSELVTISSNEINNFIGNMAKVKGSMDDPESEQGVLIGAYQTTPYEDKKWAWSSGRSWTFENWARGQPNYGGERCVVIGYYQFQYTWHDIRCSHKRGYICSKSPIGNKK